MSLLNLSDTQFNELYLQRPFRGIRINPLKSNLDTVQSGFDFKLEQTPFFKNSYYIPKDFEGKIFRKSVIDETDVVVIYFDETKWNVGDMAAWHKCIQEFCERPLLVLPKSFSRLEYITNKDLKWLKSMVDKAVEQIE